MLICQPFFWIFFAVQAIAAGQFSIRTLLQGIWAKQYKKRYSKKRIFVILPGRLILFAVSRYCRLGEG
jgi:hypothetical protein